MKKSVLIISLLCIIFLFGGIAYAGKYALVIGNNDYTGVPLDTPVNDANAMASALKGLGFSVAKETDVNQQEMEQAIQSFGRRLSSGDVALFYYSGHGVQVDGINYLIPLGVSKDMIRYRAVPANVVLDKMESAGTQVNIVILDACRNNPFKGAKGVGDGLAPMQGAKGSFIAYATAPGQIAWEGTGSSSIFTKHLVDVIKTPGLRIEDIFKKVRVSVMSETSDKQMPWESSSLIGDFYFAAGTSTPPVVRPSQPVVTHSQPSYETKQRITNSIGMEFVYISPGSFMMGSPENEPGRSDHERQHRVTLTKGFYMQTTEVTQGQWKAVMGNNPSYFQNCGSNCPVEMVSWNDTQEFIKKLNHMESTDKYRMPTEAEWEYACRAETTTAYSWGNSADCSKANYGSGLKNDECKGKNPDKTMTVASFSPNAWGLYDMHGNVYEWVADIYGDTIYTAAQTDPIYIGTGSYRVLRGGSWDNDARLCRSAYRGGYSPDGRDYLLGSRLLRDAP